MSEKISIVVPIYKVEKFLDRCMNSIINQTYKNIEIILVDDGSPDNCPQLCDQYSEIDQRIVVIHKKNGGLSDARNAGLDIATGEFVIFVDSDDYIESDLCEKCIKLFSDDIDIVAYRFRRFFDDHIEVAKESGTFKVYSNKEICEKYIERKIISHMVCDKMFRRSLFKDKRFIKGRLAEDLAICYKLIGEARNVVIYDKVFYNYYTRSNSIMGMGSKKLTLDAYQGEIETRDYILENYPNLSKNIDIRFLNQSMKVYLKLFYRHNVPRNDESIKIVSDNIKMISKKNLPYKTMFYYILFILNKRVSWSIFKLLRMS